MIPEQDRKHHRRRPRAVCLPVAYERTSADQAMCRADIRLVSIAELSGGQFVLFDVVLGGEFEIVL